MYGRRVVTSAQRTRLDGVHAQGDTWVGRVRPLASPGVAFSAVLILATGLSFATIGAKSLWLDEAFSVAVAALDTDALLQVVSGDQANMALYYLLLHAWLGVGTSETAVRSLSAGFAVASLAPLYAVGTKLFDRRVAVVACLLLSVNAFFVQYAQEARAYALLVFLITAASYLFVAALNRPTVATWAAYAVVMSLAIYAHLFAALFAGAHAVSLVCVRPAVASWRRALLAFGAIGILVAPLVPVVFTVKHAGWVAPATYRTLMRTAGELTGYGGWPLIAAYAVLCVVALAAHVRVRPSHDQATDRWQHSFVLIWLVLPIVVALLFSVLVRPIFLGRYLIGVLPALALLAAAGVWTFRSRVLRIAAVAVLVLLSARGLAGWYGGMPKEDWRAATSYVLARARPGDHVAFHPSYVRTAFDYYALPAGDWSWVPPETYPLSSGALYRLDPAAPVRPLTVWVMVSKEKYVPLASLQPRWLRPSSSGSFCPGIESPFDAVRVVQMVPCSSLTGSIR